MFLDSSGWGPPGADQAEEVDDLEVDHQRLSPRGRWEIRVQVHRKLSTTILQFQVTRSKLESF